MFDLSVPVGELLARAALIYFGVLLLIRLSGKRTIGEFSPFDVIVMLLLAEAAEGALTGGEESVPGALLVVATLIGLNYGVAFLSTRSKRFERIVEGQPVILIKNGKLVPDVLKKTNLPEGDLDEAMRTAEIRHRREVELAILEPDGEISFFKRQGRD
jgi:uncharacterized membrane protein YcaP (DUF421 family)